MAVYQLTFDNGIILTQAAPSTTEAEREGRRRVGDKVARLLDVCRVDIEIVPNPRTRQVRETYLVR